MSISIKKAALCVVIGIAYATLGGDLVLGHAATTRNISANATHISQSCNSNWVAEESGGNGTFEGTMYFNQCLKQVEAEASGGDAFIGPSIVTLWEWNPVTSQWSNWQAATLWFNQNPVYRVACQGCSYHIDVSDGRGNKYASLPGITFPWWN